MAVPVVAARAAIARLVDDLEAWIVRFAILALCLVAQPASAAAVGFGGLLAIFGNVAPHAAAPALPRQTAEGLAAVTPAVVRIGASGGRLIDGWTNPAALNQSTELTTASALTVARQYRPAYKAHPSVPSNVLVAGRDRFDVADAAALPWPDNSVDLLVTSPPYALNIEYVGGGDVESYAQWLQVLETWLQEMSRVSRVEGGRLYLNVPLDRDRGGWEPVWADVLEAARANGWRFRTWLLWDKGQVSPSHLVLHLPRTLHQRHDGLVVCLRPI